MNAGAGGQSERGATNLISSRREAKADTEANTISPLRDTHTHTHTHTHTPIHAQGHCDNISDLTSEVPSDTLGTRGSVWLICCKIFT